jgi:hypothetical protein
MEADALLAFKHPKQLSCEFDSFLPQFGGQHIRDPTEEVVLKPNPFDQMRINRGCMGTSSQSAIVTIKENGNLSRADKISVSTSSRNYHPPICYVLRYLLPSLS